MVWLIVFLIFVVLIAISTFAPTIRFPKKIESEINSWELKRGTPQWDIYKGTKLYELELWWDKEHLDHIAFYDKYGFSLEVPGKKDYQRALRGASEHFHIAMDPDKIVSFIPKNRADFVRTMIHGSSALISEIDDEVEQTRRELREYQIEMRELERERRQIAKTMLDGLKKKELMWGS